MQEQKQAWSLSSSTLELSHAAAWDARTQHFYAVASVRTGATKVAVGPRQRLLGWPADFNQPLEDAPISLELASAVHAVHPIFPAAAGSGTASEQEEGHKASNEQHNSSSGQAKHAEETAATTQKQKVRELLADAIITCTAKQQRSQVKAHTCFLSREVHVICTDHAEYAGESEKQSAGYGPDAHKPAIDPDKAQAAAGQAKACCCYICRAAALDAGVDSNRCPSSCHDRMHI